MNKPLSEILQIVCEEFEVKEDQIKSKRRTEPVAYARMAYMQLARELTDETTTSIARFVNKDHTSVSYAVNTFRS